LAVPHEYDVSRPALLLGGSSIPLEDLVARLF